MREQCWCHHHSRKPQCGCEDNLGKLGYHGHGCKSRRDCLLECSRRLNKCLESCKSYDEYGLECCVQDAIRCFDRCFY